MMWVAVSTQPNREMMAIDNLRRQGYEVYCPMLARERRHARRVEQVKRPLFPGYVFVCLKELVQGGYSIHSTYGVKNLVKFGDRPARLADGFISALRAREVDGVIPPPPMEEVLPQGSRVLIKDGAFKDLMATVVGCGAHDRVIVLMDLLKRSVKTGVSAHYLEHAS